MLIGVIVNKLDISCFWKLARNLRANCCIRSAEGKPGAVVWAVHILMQQAELPVSSGSDERL